MKRLQEYIQGIRGFVQDVVSETRKSTWPERQELIESTNVVIISVLLLSAFVGVCDAVLVALLKLVMP
jgi:preprotein translocase subunit SecE